jgi:SH3 domain protein
LKAKHEKAMLELSNQKKRADQLEKELTDALKSKHIKWFLSGAGVLIFGMLLGFSSKREKRRSSLL